MGTEPVIQNEKSLESSQSSGRALILHPLDCVGFESIVTIDHNESTLGSSAECDVPLPFPEIAAHHVTILDCEDEWTLKSNDKKTWINGNMVQISDLKHGDRLKIGTLEFEIELKSQLDEDPPAIKEKSATLNHANNNARKKNTGLSNTEARSQTLDRKNQRSLDTIISSNFSEIDKITQNEIAECLTILKSLQDELENDTEEMNKLKQDLEKDREQLLAERENLTTERKQLRDGFAALTQAREAIKTRENLLEERERLLDEQSHSQSHSDLGSLYRKSEVEKIHDLRSELADQFELELNDEEECVNPGESCNLMPVFSDEELRELESTKSLCQQDGFTQNEDGQVGEDVSENEVHEEVSVQEYMQDLLQRSRQGSPDDEARNSHVTDQIQESRKKSANESPAELSNSKPDIVDVRKIQAKHQIDKQSVRADLQSMRELANISARSAIAEHSTKRLKYSICLKLVLTTVSFFLGVAILFLTSEGFHISSILQAAAVSIGTIALVELYRTMNQAKKSLPSKSDQPDDDGSEIQNIEFEINDSAILNNPAFITEEYRSNLMVSENEFSSPSEAFGVEDKIEVNDGNVREEEPQTVCAPCSNGQNEAISSKDVIMEIPVEAENEGE